MYIENFIDEERANSICEKLRENLQWGEGIKTRYGNFTRYQLHILNFNNIYLTELILSLANEAFNFLGLETSGIMSIYLNYYENGDHYCPKHRHVGTKQILLSFGSERNLYIDNKKFNLKNGSLIAFGEEYHEVKKERNRSERISIVIFYS